MEYMSQEGYDKLVAELRQLVQVEMPRVKDAISEARAMGDLSENFEYHAAKREQGKLLSRINYLEKVLEHTRVLDANKLNCDTVKILCKVEITNLNTNARMTYTMVSPNESNLREMKLSIKSPIGQALLNRRVGDTVQVQVPAGIVKLRIESISL